jgi:hypothetical protein
MIEAKIFKFPAKKKKTLKHTNILLNFKFQNVKFILHGCSYTIVSLVFSISHTLKSKHTHYYAWARTNNYLRAYIRTQRKL